MKSLTRLQKAWIGGFVDGEGCITFSGKRSRHMGKIPANGRNGMDPDVQAKLDKLCSRYTEAAAAVELLKPAKSPTRKAQYRTEARVVDILGGLRESRKPSGAALVRLAYVRGLRSTKPGARLTEEQEREVAYLERQLDGGLGKLEEQALLAFREHTRRLRLADTMASRQVSQIMVDACRPQGEPYPLEQRARTRARVVVEMASTAGALAGTVAGEYDGERDA